MPWVYPRVGGETISSRSMVHSTHGLSPRGRGNLIGGRRNCFRWRSIPAWAGKPRSTRSATSTTTVYPRVGGETSIMALPLRFGYGSIPAWAGNPRHLPARRYVHRSIPRGRGNLSSVSVPPAVAGSIPAWAGKPRPSSPKPAVGVVYPRVGGETDNKTHVVAEVEGLSPRGRGNPVDR